VRRTVIALLLLLSGTAAAEAQSAPAKPSQPKQAAVKQTAAKPATPQNGPCAVGVVSQLGEKFTVRKIGYTVFGNDINEVPVESWHIDDLVVAKISAALGKRAVVKRIPYHKEAFASLETLKLFRDTEAEVRDGVRTLAVSTRCAHYLLVTRAYHNLGNTNQTIGGIGVLHTGIGELFVKINAYALFSLRLYDGETFALLKRAHAPSGDSIFTQWIGGPPESTDNAVQNAKLREAIRDLVAQGMGRDADGTTVDRVTATLRAERRQPLRLRRILRRVHVGLEPRWVSRHDAADPPARPAARA
jgi:hypothetical protein